MKLETIELPDWYLFKKIKGQISIDDLVSLGRKKIDLLLEVTKDKEKASMIPPNPQVEVIGGLALRILAAITEDRFFISWLIESEGDLLYARFSNSTLEERISILKDLFGELIIGWREITYFFNVSKDEVWQELFYLIKDNIKSKQEAARYFNMIYNSESGIIAVRFWSAPRLLKRKRGILRSGWILTPTDFLIKEIKWKFQRKLNEVIKKLIVEKKAGSQKILVLENAMRELSEYWTKKRDVVVPKREFSLKGRRLYERIDLWPLCMKVLLSRYEATGYLSHGERLQLGLFLKKLGMTLEEQLQFWYKAVDNLGMSWEEFERKGGYHIKHIYGVVGSRKDYEAPKCETIISKYFCPFKALSSEQIKDILKQLHADIPDKLLKKIMENTRRGEPRKACAVYLTYVARRQFKLNLISHPLQFVKLAYMREKKKRGENEPSADTQ